MLILMVERQNYLGRMLLPIFSVIIVSFRNLFLVMSKTDQGHILHPIHDRFLATFVTWQLRKEESF
jgi:hypothetical protein